MKLLCRFLGIPLLAIVGMGLLFPLAAAADSPAKATTIELSVPASGVIGTSMHISATLTDAGGKPVVGATVGLYTSATFLSTRSGPMLIGEAKTDSGGVAAFDYTPDSSTTMEVRAEYAGDAGFLPSNAISGFAVTGSQDIYTESAPLRVPGINRWLLGGVFIMIYSLYLFVVSRVYKIQYESGR